MKLILTLFALSAIFCGQIVAVDKKPLKVFILAGQSNMEGHAKIETFDYIGDDPATVPLLKMMRGADGNPTVCDGVCISYFTGSGDKNGEGFGKLAAAYGSRSKPDQDGGKIGPEFTFGLTMDAVLAEPVLVIMRRGVGKVCTRIFVHRARGRMSSTRRNSPTLRSAAKVERSRGRRRVSAAAQAWRL